MAQLIDNTNSTIWVAIDVTKHLHVALIEYPNGSRKSFKFPNNHAGYQDLLKHVKRKRHQVIAGFEATANYHRCLAYFLQQHQVLCHFFSSVATARTRESLHNSLDKHDPKDAQVILHLLKTNVKQIYYDPLIEGINDLQELSNTYKQISKMKTRILHSIRNHYFPLYFPEADNYMPSSREKWFLNLLTQYPAPSAILVLPKEKFIEEGLKVKGKK